MAMPPSLLDRLLIRSTLYRAFQRVWENGGCRGSDGVTVGRFRDRIEWELDSISDSLIRRCYRPLPLLRFPVGKTGGSGLRHLSVPSVRDRVVQSAVYLVTKDRFEAEFEDSSYAYREGRSVRQAVHRIRELRDRGFSPMLANLYLDRLDEELAAAGLVAVRYADDFVLLCRAEGEAAAALEVTDGLLEALELDLNRAKTQIHSFEQDFKFLGALFVGDSVFLPLERAKDEGSAPRLPEPLTLRVYLELKAALELRAASPPE